MLRNTGRYFSIMEYLQGGIWLDLQQNNHPKRTTNVIKNYLQCWEVLEVMVWPWQTHVNLNISESVWDYKKRQKELRQPTSTDLWLVLQGVWCNLPAKFIQKLCVSVPRRIGAGLQVKGGHTKYWLDLSIYLFIHFPFIYLLINICILFSLRLLSKTD